MIFTSQPGRRLLDTKSGYPYTRNNAIAQTGINMNQTKIGYRMVVIAGTAPANEKTDYREPTGQRPTAQRIVVIKNGKLVSSRPGH